MAQPATNPKIDELRLRLKADPKSRLFFPLAEELRKSTQLAEAEQVLRTGLASHPTYLSAWVSLGRVLRDSGNNAGAVESLTKALQLDPGNVVAARLLADAYLALGEKVEAIKKYKLVHALLPADQDLEALIQKIDREINGGLPIAAPEPEPEPEPAAPEHAAAESQPQPEASMTGADEPFSPMPTMETPFAEAFGGASADEAPATEATASPFDEPEPSERAAMPTLNNVPLTEATGDESPWNETDEARVFSDADAALTREEQLEVATGDVEPMLAAHATSPFEDQGSDFGYGSDAFAIDQPQGMHIARAPLAAEVAEPFGGDDENIPTIDAEPVSDVPLVTGAYEMPTAGDASDVFAPAAASRATDDDEPYIETGIASDLPFALESTLPPAEADDFAKTITMADLYASQGLVDEARDIYEDILARDPHNASVRAKLEALDTMPHEAPPPPEDETYYDDEESAQPPQPWTPSQPLAALSHEEAPAAAAEDDVFASPFEAPVQPEPEVEPIAPLAPMPEAIPAPPAVLQSAARLKVARLEAWLSKVKKREVSGVS